MECTLHSRVLATLNEHNHPVSTALKGLHRQPLASTLEVFVHGYVEAASYSVVALDGLKARRRRTRKGKLMRKLSDEMDTVGWILGNDDGTEE